MKLNPSYETETYLSAGGYFCIKQKDWDGTDQVILLSKDQAAAIADEISRVLEDPESFIPEDGNGEGNG